MAGGEGSQSSKDQDKKNESNDDDIENENDVTNQIAAQLQIKIPIFWVTRPTLWFVQIETQFRMKGIKSD